MRWFSRKKPTPQVDTTPGGLHDYLVACLQADSTLLGMAVVAVRPPHPEDDPDSYRTDTVTAHRPEALSFDELSRTAVQSLKLHYLDPKEKNHVQVKLQAERHSPQTDDWATMLAALDSTWVDKDGLLSTYRKGR